MPPLGTVTVSGLKEMSFMHHGHALGAGGGAAAAGSPPVSAGGCFSLVVAPESALDESSLSSPPQPVATRPRARQVQSNASQVFMKFSSRSGSRHIVASWAADAPRAAEPAPAQASGPVFQALPIGLKTGATGPISYSMGGAPTPKHASPAHVSPWRYLPQVVAVTMATVVLPLVLVELAQSLAGIHSVALAIPLAIALSVWRPPSGRRCGSAVQAHGTCSSGT